MDKSALKDVTYGSIRELMRNPDYYYHSNVSSDFSYWTESGKTALLEHLQMIAWLMFRTEHDELDARAKQLVMDSLKGD
jgi:hypothetical protein